MRRRLFGRSHDSSLSVGGSSHRHSKDGASLAAFSVATKDKESTEKDKGKEKESSSPITVGSRHRTKRSMDGKSSDRPISIFGATFGVGGSLSKGRKPPPRYVPLPPPK